MRKEIPINFSWQFARNDHNKENLIFKKIDIPHTNIDLPFNYFSEKDYQFSSIYKKDLKYKFKKNKRYFLKFEGVLHYANVYMNDIHIGNHFGGYTEFTFEITNAIREYDNTLIVYVDASEKLNIPPFGKVIDYLTYGGIYREVTLIETPIAYIDSIKIKATNILKTPKLEFDISHFGGNNVTISISKKEKLILSKKFSLDEKIEITHPFSLWDLDNPCLYDFSFILDSGDTYKIKTGIRQTEFRNDGFYLNDKLVKIVGLNRHQIYPFVGYAMPKSAQEYDASLLKKLGNAVRTSHYPQSKHFLNKCDELGLLVFIEAPGWQFIGNEAWQDIYVNNIREMIIANRHHPSIILWGVRVNESPDNSELYEKTNKLAKTLDDRPTGGVRDFSHSDLLEDVYTYNDFQYNGMNRYIKPRCEVVDRKVPYLITEYVGHMFPTKSFDNSNRRLEQALRHAHILNSFMAKNNNIAGGFGWHFIDYYSHKEFGSGDRICYHGVLDLFRIEKEAAKIYASQEAKTPYLEILNANDLGDYDKGHLDTFYIASNCSSIDVYQNERFIGKFFPDIKTFPNLKHPLYIINDLYGDAYEKIGISKKESKEYIKLAHEIASRGGKEKIEKTDIINHEKFQIAWDMYGKYIANWGSDTFKYTFVGNYQDQTIKKVLSPGHYVHLKINVDTNVLNHGATYDVAKVDIIAVDENENIRNYLNQAFNLEATGSISVIGPKLISLIGGRYSVWVKSEKRGNGKLIISNDRFKQEIQFIVNKLNIV